MFSGAFTEWSPAFGESWQIVQVPVIESGTVIPLGNVCPFRPATPAIVIGFVLKIVCPRAIEVRMSVNGSCEELVSLAQASNRLNALESNVAPPGFRPTGSL